LADSGGTQDRTKRSSESDFHSKAGDDELGQSNFVGALTRSAQECSLLTFSAKPRALASEQARQRKLAG
jgi:hypothetical protein